MLETSPNYNPLHAVLGIPEPDIVTNRRRDFDEGLKELTALAVIASVCAIACFVIVLAFKAPRKYGVPRVNHALEIVLCTMCLAAGCMSIAVLPMTMYANTEVIRTASTKKHILHIL